VDPDKIQRVVANLLSNAIKFAPPNGALRAVLQTDPSNACAVLEVSDSGPGVPAEQRDAVFERFRQLDGGKTRRFGGTGLGLALARDFVDLHGGELTLSTAPEGGALFTASFPLRAPVGARVRRSSSAPPLASGERAAVAQQPARSSADAVPSAADSELPLVLVVEDHPQMNRFICAALASRYRVQSAENGREGLAKALELAPDLIVSDVMMPEMSGDELVGALRSNPIFDDTPIIVVSARADDDLRIRVLAAGANDYITKPVVVAELRARAQNLIRTKLAHQETQRLSQDLQRVNEELRSLTSDIDAFNHAVSHDLRAGIRRITAFSSLLRRDYAVGLGAQGCSYVERVCAGLKRLSDLTCDLMTLSKATRVPLHRERTNVTELARAIVDELRSAEPSRALEATIAEGLVAYADPRLLKIAFENLLANAWKFTAKKPEARITVGSIDAGADLVAFFVRDNGAGFDMQHVSKLFTPFNRLHSDREFEGSGVGLSTVQRVVTRHGGQIWAEAAPERGATFCFTLGRA
jgi:signal transduction histidine kinase